VVFSAPLLGLFILIGGVIGFLSACWASAGSFMIRLVAIFGHRPRRAGGQMAFGAFWSSGRSAARGFTVHRQRLGDRWLPPSLASTSIISA
jgi:hypothetical protein